MVTLPSTPRLIIQTELGKRHLSLGGGDYWVIGRSKDNTIALADLQVSRKHAMLQHLKADIYSLTDLSSRNGSFVNGQRINAPVILKHGDRLSFGNTELEFQCLPVFSPVNSTADLPKPFLITPPSDQRKI